MLWNSSALTGYAIQAIDGNIGSVSDVLFEDVKFCMRWLVVDTGNWLPGRKVLLPVSALGHPDRELRLFPVKLTMQQVRDSPDIDTDMPVSRQHEADIFDYYGWDPYWGGGLYPVAAMANSARALDSPTAPGTTKVPHDQHLRSIAAITGYHIHATDGNIGHAADFLLDEEGWSLRYMCVDTGNWWPGQQVLIAPGSIRAIDWGAQLIHLDVDCSTLRGRPPYNPAMTVDGAYDDRFRSYYGINFVGL